MFFLETVLDNTCRCIYIYISMMKSSVVSELSPLFLSGMLPVKFLGEGRTHSKPILLWSPKKHKKPQADDCFVHVGILVQKLWPNVGRRQMKRRAGQMSIEVGFQAIYVIRINHVEFEGHSWVCWSMTVLSENYMPADKCLCENPFVTVVPCK